MTIKSDFYKMDISFPQSKELNFHFCQSIEELKNHIRPMFNEICRQLWDENHIVETDDYDNIIGIVSI